MTDRPPPHSAEIEQAFLGSLLKLGDYDPAARAEVLATIGEDSFFDPIHATMFRHLKAIGMVEPATAMRLLRDRMSDGDDDDAYLMATWASVPNCLDIIRYAYLIREKAMLRGIITLANDALRNAYAPKAGETASGLLNSFAARAVKLAASGSGHTIHSLGDVALEVYEAKEGGQQARIRTGLMTLDDVIGGLRVGGKTIVGAKAGMGKSLLIKQIGLNLANRGVPFGLISVEESRHKIAENLLSNTAGVVNARVSFGQLGSEEWKKLSAGVAALSGLPFYMVDSARRISHIVGAAHALVHKHGCKVIAVDHLHIVDGETDEQREREISKISGELKWAWKDLGVAGLEAAQLNRGSGRERPGLHNLRDSGSLEQDADVVLMPHREDYYRGQGEHHDNVLECIVAKNKDGAPGVVPLQWDGARQRITDFAIG